MDLGKKVHEVLLKILVDKGAWHLNKNHPLSLIEVLKDDWLEPRVIYLPGYILLNELQGFLPPGINFCCHFAVSEM